jgi:crotonobetainyl-CoA:carnitine CoA-transferase CaiB-like acyl-CoA transferase
VFPTAGDEQWLALSVETDAQWESLAELIGLDPQRHPSHDTRVAAHDEIDAAVATWAAQQTTDAAVAILADAGVPAVACRNHGMLRFHPQFVARGFFEEVAHPAVGTHLMPAQPFRIRGVERWVRRPTPTLGQHNREVLGEAGLSDAEIDELVAAGEIGTTPVF